MKLYKGRWVPVLPALALILSAGATAMDRPGHAAVGGTGVATTVATDPPVGPAAPAGGRAARAVAAAAELVAGRPRQLHAGPDDEFVAQPAISSLGWSYVPYQRTYRGLPVVGGDFVVVVDPSGTVASVSVAQQRPISGLATVSKLSRASARQVSSDQLDSVSAVEGSRLVVYALGGAPRLAWETTVTGVDDGKLSQQRVLVDAATGEVLDRLEQVSYDRGVGAYNGPDPLPIAAARSPSDPGMRILKDPVTKNLSCADIGTRVVFDSTDDLWGNGDELDLETQCVDAMYAAQTQVRMLSAWLGRNGMDGNGGAWPIYVGLDENNAFFAFTEVQIGRDLHTGKPLTAMDVVAHEMGHGIDFVTPGGLSRQGTREFIADVFATATEWFANQPFPYDIPDYAIGETSHATTAYRYMFDPRKKPHHLNCYQDDVDTVPVHAAAGVGNHWFYLLAEGTDPTNGQPASSTCNDTALTGIGIKRATQIVYHALLMKTTDSSYPAYRTWTLTAAKNLFPDGCVTFTKVRAAWDAVGVPAQPDDPHCQRGGPWITNARTGDGRIEQYAHQGSGLTFRRWQTIPGGPWSGWHLFSGTRLDVTDLTAAAHADGRRELFGIDRFTGQVAHRGQTGPDGTWSVWSMLDQTAAAGVPAPTYLTSIATVRSTAGDLELFAVDGPSGRAYRRTRTEGAGQALWSAWQQFGEAPKRYTPWGWAYVPAGFHTVVAATNGTGGIEVFATNAAGEVLHRPQDSGGDWSDWTYLDGTGFTGLAVARHGDGLLHLYGINAGQVYHRQPGTSDSWSPWSGFGDLPAALIDLDAAVGADGRVTVLGVAADGQLYRRAQQIPDSSWSAWVAFGTIGITDAVVPDVRDMTIGQASQVLLASAGAFASQVTYFTDLTCNNIGTVKSQIPAAGTTAGIDTVVRLSVGTRPAPPYVCN